MDKAERIGKVRNLIGSTRPTGGQQRASKRLDQSAMPSVSLISASVIQRADVLFVTGLTSTSFVLRDEARGRF